VFAVNVRARELYERLGFRVEEEHDGRLKMGGGLRHSALRLAPRKEVP
jgi:ribosomal protein S18 acetylase RimI-like enzyme